MGKYLYLPTTEFSEIFKSGTEEVQYIFGSVNYHRNDFWRLKMGWNLTTIDLMSTNPSILVYANWEYSIHTSLTLIFKWLVQINSPFTLGRLARLSQRIQKALTGSYNSCQIIIGISWFIVNTVSKILCTAIQCKFLGVSGTGTLTHIRWEYLYLSLYNLWLLITKMQL